MARLIDSSINGVVGCEVSLTWLGKLKIVMPYSWKSHVYTQEQIVSVTPIDEDKYRSAGGAALGAIVGGVLTGGIGLIAGAAFGGRRRQRSAYLVTFNDGHHVAFEEIKKANLKLLNQLVQSAKVKSLISERDILITRERINLIEGTKTIEASPRAKLIDVKQVTIPQVVNTPPDQPEIIHTSKGWIIFWGLVALLFSLTFYISLENGVGVSFLLAFSIVLPLFLVTLAFMLVRKIYRWAVSK